jgi:hypothetical protein
VLGTLCSGGGAFRTHGIKCIYKPGKGLLKRIIDAIIYGSGPAVPKSANQALYKIYSERRSEGVFVYPRDPEDGKKVCFISRGTLKEPKSTSIKKGTLETWLNNLVLSEGDMAKLKTGGFLPKYAKRSRVICKHYVES